MKKIVFGIVLLAISLFLSNGLSIVSAQGKLDSEYSNITTNLTQIFGEPIYKETSRQESNSIVLDVKESIKTQDSYIATGHLKDVGNVTDKSTFVTTYQPGGNISSSTGHGIITTADGEIATYTGHDLGITGINGTQIYRGMEIFQTDSYGKLAYLDNLIGLYEYKSGLDGKKSGIIWKWK
jgi:hypothetical protein